MNIQHLQYIIEINNSGSISKAAAKLYITQPHLSKILQDTEMQFNIIIFQRTKSGVALTEDGREFVDYAVKILRDIERMGEIYENKHREQNKLKISSVPISHTMDACISLCNKFSSENFTFIYKEQYYDDVIRDVYSGEAELGVLVISSGIKNMALRHIGNKGIIHIPVCSSEMYILVRNEHPLALRGTPVHLEEIYNYGLIITDVLKGFTLDGYSSSIVNSVVNLERAKNLIMVNSRAALHGMINGTDCISFGTKSIKNQNTTIGMVSLPIIYEKQTTESLSNIWIIHLENRNLSPIAEEFVNIFTSTYGNLFK